MASPISSAKTSPHPCMACGACCASFRVAFHWREAEINLSDITALNVPPDYTEDLDFERRCMKGTNKKHQPKCIALNGRIGQKVSCQIYSNRPSVCRRFEASYENGYPNPRCDEARAKHGMPPLLQKDFPKVLDHVDDLQIY